MKYLVYLHGFNSSPQSEKAQKVLAHFHNHKHLNCLEVLVPALPPAPSDAIKLIKEMIESRGAQNLIGFIGSSLGGFYSLYLQRLYVDLGLNVKAVLVNPAVRPYDLLLDYLGENQNIYTGERYVIELSHMEELKTLIVEPVLSPSMTMLLTQTGDEVLPFQEAVTHLSGVKMWVQYGGSHAFDGFDSVLGCLYAFCVEEKT